MNPNFDLTKSALWLIGSGEMAFEYCHVLDRLFLSQPYLVIGRGEQKAKELEAKTGKKILSGGIERALHTLPVPDSAIVAVGVSELFSVSMQLLKAGVKHLLIEKPAGLTLEEIEELSDFAQVKNTPVWIAYNRRYYPSVLELEARCKQDHGISSFQFEFTEWADSIQNLNRSKEIKENWFLANSSHPIDLAFYLGGMAETLSAYTIGELAWHPSGAVFVGSGITNRKLPFSYHANWNAPGRWGIEICTKHYRFFLRPLEKLFVQNRNEVSITEISLPILKEEEGLKPGLFPMVKDFLSCSFFQMEKNSLRIPSIQEHAKNTKIFEAIRKGISF